MIACGGPPESRPEAIPRPPRPAAESIHTLHNLQPPIAGRILSGASPDSGGAFDSLEHLGVRTIISVDGATPDIAAADARGMRYIHIPLTYAGITGAQRLEIARAVRDHPGGVYIHCHHGKHRGPAAAAIAAITLGMMTPEDGVIFMRQAGTAEGYTGLYATVAGSTVATMQEIDSAPDDFPAIRRARGITAAMVEVDLAFEHLREIRDAGWEVPAGNPDLVPAAEAGRLADNLRIGHEDPRARAKGEEFLKLLLKSAEEASALEEGLANHASPKALEASFKLVEASCQQCHTTYRNAP